MYTPIHTLTHTHSITHSKHKQLCAGILCISNMFENINFQNLIIVQQLGSRERKREIEASRVGRRAAMHLQLLPLPHVACTCCSCNNPLLLLPFSIANQVASCVCSRN